MARPERDPALGALFRKMREPVLRLAPPPVSAPNVPLTAGQLDALREALVEKAGYRPDQRRGPDGRWVGEGGGKMSFTEFLARMSSGLGDGEPDEAGVTHTLDGTPGFDRTVSLHGRAFKPTPLPADLKFARGPVGECYRNAVMALSADPKLRYVEGRVRSAPGGPLIAHAWVTRGVGGALDVTLPDPGSDYFGVEVPREAILHAVLARGVSGPSLEWPEIVKLLHRPVRKAGFRDDELRDKAGKWVKEGVRVEWGDARPHERGTVKKVERRKGRSTMVTVAVDKPKYDYEGPHSWPSLESLRPAGATAEGTKAFEAGLPYGYMESPSPRVKAVVKEEGLRIARELSHGHAPDATLTPEQHVDRGDDVMNCDEASRLWAAAFKKHGVKARELSGHYGGDTNLEHVWLEVEGKVFDPTAAQFGKKIHLKAYAPHVLKAAFAQVLKANFNAAERRDPLTGRWSSAGAWLSRMGARDAKRFKLPFDGWQLKDDWTGKHSVKIGYGVTGFSQTGKPGGQLLLSLADARRFAQRNGYDRIFTVDLKGVKLRGAVRGDGGLGLVVRDPIPKSRITQVGAAEIEIKHPVRTEAGKLKRFRSMTDENLRATALDITHPHAPLAVQRDSEAQRAVQREVARRGLKVGPPYHGYYDRATFSLHSESDAQFVGPLIEAAAEAISHVHRWPSGAQPTARVVTTNKRFQYGAFHVRSGPYGQDTYKIKRDHDSPLTMIHELGHGLDYGALADKYGADTSDYLRPTGSAAKEAMQLVLAHPADVDLNGLEKVMMAISKSDAFAAITRRAESDRNVRFGDAQFAKYMLNPTELFARAYAQYIVAHAGDDALTEQMRKDELTRTIGWYWTPTDFKAVDRAMKAMLKELGWDRDSRH